MKPHQQTERYSVKELFLLIALLAVIFFTGSQIMKLRSECHAKGGAYVRGVIWFECVAGAKP